MTHHPRLFQRVFVAVALRDAESVFGPVEGIQLPDLIPMWRRQRSTELIPCNKNSQPIRDDESGHSSARTTIAALRFSEVA